MAAKSPYAFFPLFLLLINIYNVQAQASTTRYNCEANQSIVDPCEAYVVYRATGPDFLDLASIADLFGVTRLAVAEASNISPPSSRLRPRQPVVVPVECSCNSVNTSYVIYYATVPYRFKKGETYISASSRTFQNLTTSLTSMYSQDYLDTGDKVELPILCTCPKYSDNNRAFFYFVTYVFQPDDTLSAVASMFNTPEEFILENNGKNISPFDAVFIPVSQHPRLPYEPLSASGESGVVLGMGIGLGICGGLLVLVFGLWCYREVKFKKMGGMYRDEEKQKVDGRLLKHKDEMKLMVDVAGCLDKYKVFKIDELRKATNGFDDGFIIRGSVYRGCIDNEIYAIKKIKWDAYQELKILQKVNHGNLVRLEGFCIDPKDSNCYVVYEYIENGSLYSWLHVEKNKRLSWNTRLRIAIDVAKGLQYIHEHTRPKVVHKDIKSSNILLDSNMRAKMASFGLAKSGYNALTMHIVGTRGYIAPEYLAEGAVSTKMDVFSFGVVLLELISAGEVIDEEGKFLWAKFDGILDEGKLRKLRELRDGCLNEDSCTLESVMRVMVVAIACLNKDPIRRPNMEEIVYALSRNDDLVPFDVSEELYCPR